MNERDKRREDGAIDPPSTNTLFSFSQVTIYTAHHDPARAFKETVNGPFAVRVAGAWFPRTVGGKAVALCAYVRCILAALRLAWDSWR